MLRGLLDDVFGLELLQLGSWGASRELLSTSRTRRQTVIADCSGCEVDVVAKLTALPVQTATIDAVLLPHTLEFEADPHAIVREADRVLTGEGQLIVLGFRPVSLWGLRAAASQAVAPEIAKRAERVSGAPNEEFVLATDGYVRWRGEVIANLAEGDTLLAPRLIVLADESLSGPELERVQDRLNLWLRHTINTQLEAVMALAEPPEDAYRQVLAAATAALREKTARRKERLWVLWSGAAAVRIGAPMPHPSSASRD